MDGESSTGTIRVLVCEPSNVGAAALVGALGGERRIEARTGPARAEDLTVAATDFGARVVLVGPDFPRGALSGAIAQLLQHDCRALILSSHPLDEQGAQLLLAGASGYLLMKDATPAALSTAVVRVASGATALHPDVVAAVFERWRRSHAVDDAGTGKGTHRPLTARELDVLRGLNSGLTNRALASRLGVAEKTVEAHKSRLYAKLGARNQAHAVRIAAERGIL